MDSRHQIENAPRLVPAPTNSIAKKICQIMAECENLEKKGYNEFHKYHYVREAEAVNGIRGLLGKYGLAIIPNLQSEEVKEVETRNGRQYLTRAKIQYTLLCADTGEERQIDWAGFGQDTGEKGFYKALAGSHKYLLMKLFNVSAGDEMDPENENKTNGNKEAPRGNQRKQQQQAPPTEKQQQVDPLALARKAMFDHGKKCGYNGVDMKNLIASQYPTIKAWTQLTQEQIDSLIQFTTANPKAMVGSDDDIAQAGKETVSTEQAGVA